MRELDRLNIDIIGLCETFLEGADYILRPTEHSKRTHHLVTFSTNQQSRQGVDFLEDTRPSFEDIHQGNEHLTALSMNDKNSEQSSLRFTY